MHCIDDRRHLERTLLELSRQDFITESAQLWSLRGKSKSFVQAINEGTIFEALKLLAHLFGTGPDNRAVRSPERQQRDRACLEETLEGDLIWLHSADTADEAFLSVADLIRINLVLVSSHRVGTIGSDQKLGLDFRTVLQGDAW